MVLRPTGAGEARPPSMANVLSSTETLSLLAVAGVSLHLLYQSVVAVDEVQPLVASFSLSVLAFALTYAMIRWLGPTFARAGLRGVDLCKRHRPELPESMGAVCAVVYLMTIILFIPFPFYKDIVAATSGGGNRDVVFHTEAIDAHALESQVSFVNASSPHGRLLHKFPHSKLASYLSAIISLQVIALLGMADDLFDVRWRHKWWIPGLASIPLLVVYFVDFGVTCIVVPIQLQPFLGELVDLGWLYYLYMACFAMFCPQSINMLAGINGIEVAQCVVVAVLLAANDCLYLVTSYPHPATESHLFSLYFLLPWIGVSLALLWHNWYPACVFVGDTYCYLAGMVFAVVGILGHFSKTLGLLLIPQLLNFLYSTPQIFGLLPCPRHRLPRFNPRTGLLEPSVTTWTLDPSWTVTSTKRDEKEVSSGASTPSTDKGNDARHWLATPSKQPHPLLLRLLRVLHALRLVRLETVTVAHASSSSSSSVEHITSMTNLTLLNLWLVVRGPMPENQLAREVVWLQGAVGLVALYARHTLAWVVFREDNLA